jgi:threonylcarbamoyladenosine tRNA methylthiotransferase MtaB
MKTVAFYTLGCKLNFSESSSISRTFIDKGFTKKDFHQGADVYVINTCSVTENADKKCRKVVKEALKYNSKAFIIIIGCYAQLKPTEIAEIKGVDAVLGASEKFKLLELINNFEKREETVVFAQEIKNAQTFNTSFSLNDRTRTFLKVQDGCDYTCTFCTIPLARGASRSETVANIVKSAEEIANSGVKEIVLTGVNIGDFGIIGGKKKESFLDLIKALDQVKGIQRIRISSIEPNLLSDDIIDFVSRSEKFMPHFHIPLQSGNNEILGKMRRRYKRETYTHIVNKIKKLMPHACIGVDVIVGFPSETNEHFLDTYNFINEMDVSYLHVFTYSERENTLAKEMDLVVPQKERNDRSKMLRVLSEKKKRYFYESQLNETYAALFEDKEENGKLYGFTNNYVKVGIDYDPILVGAVKNVKLKTINKEGNVNVVEMPDILHLSTRD